MDPLDPLTEIVRSGQALSPFIFLERLIWLFIGFTGFLDLLGFGKIANFAHLGGLISGIMCGYLFQMYNNRKNYE